MHISFYSPFSLHTLVTPSYTRLSLFSGSHPLCTFRFHARIMSPRNHHLAKSVSDASWSKFVTMLEYKAKWYGKPLVKIDRFYPSSKTCYHCGHVKEDLALSDRYYTCPNCGELIDRDLNAAKNILDEGLRNRSAGTVDYTDGEGVRLACKHSLMKSESHKSLACG